jgi:thiol-disulfide isomerase/thioredoxin
VEPSGNTLAALSEVQPAQAPAGPEAAVPVPTGAGGESPTQAVPGAPPPADVQPVKGAPGPEQAGREGDFARAFKLPGPGGDFVTLKEAIAQGPALIVFWASWCKPCHDLLPALSALAAKVSDENLSQGKAPVWLLAVNQGEEAPAVRKGIEGDFKEVQAEWLLDKDSSLAAEYGLRVLPTLFVVGRNGRILYRAEGSLDRDGTEASIRRHLAARTQ